MGIPSWPPGLHDPSVIQAIADEVHLDPDEQL
jgi:hypothetical protein